MRLILSTVLAVCFANNAAATDDCSADAMIVFDGSGSMAEMGFNDIQEPRIFEARRAIALAVPDIAQLRRLGLIVYGPDGPDECSGLNLRFPPKANAARSIIDAVDALEPAGSTPLTSAIQQAAETLDYKSRPATIVLVTDGKETCGGQPCALATELRTEGADTTVHIIGFKVRSDFFSWNRQDADQAPESVSKCLADDTGGTYTNAETLDQLTAALRNTLGCKLLF
ncbi:MAG: VWA domain-containing protein [Paracoccaceae bacterium]